jgi:hypothetical protein
MDAKWINRVVVMFLIWLGSYLCGRVQAQVAAEVAHQGADCVLRWPAAVPDPGQASARWLVEWSADLRTWHGATYLGVAPAGAMEAWAWPAGPVGFARVTAAELAVRWGRSPKAALTTAADLLCLEHNEHRLDPTGVYAFAAGDGFDFFAFPEGYGVPRGYDGFDWPPFPVSMAEAADGYAGDVENGWTFQRVAVGSDIYRVYRTQNVLHGPATIHVTLGP